MSSQRWPLAKTWRRWTKQAGLGVAGASGLAPSVLLTRKAILIDSGSMKDERLRGRTSSASWGSAARRAAPSRRWCCLFSACSPGSASAHPATTSMLVILRRHGAQHQHGPRGLPAPQLHCRLSDRARAQDATVSARLGDLARFTFKGLDGTMTDLFIHLVAYQLATLSGSLRWTK